MLAIQAGKKKYHPKHKEINQSDSFANATSVCRGGKHAAKTTKNAADNVFMTGIDKSPGKKINMTNTNKMNVSNKGPNALFGQIAGDLSNI